MIIIISSTQVTVITDSQTLVIPGSELKSGKLTQKDQEMTVPATPGVTVQTFGVLIEFWSGGTFQFNMDQVDDPPSKWKNTKRGALFAIEDIMAIAGPAAAVNGITELTGPVTAGPGIGVQPTTITPTGVVPGSYTNANITVGADGRITIAANGSGGGTLPDGNYGDVTVSSAGTVITVNASAITNAKLANMAAATIKGRAVGAGTGAPTDLTPAQATAILNTFTTLLKGLVPASGGGTTTFLRADGLFAVPPGAGPIGPGVTTIGNVPRWADITGTLLDNGLATSLGGNGVADNGKIVLFNAQGQIIATSTLASTDALTGTAAGSNSSGVRGIGNGAANAFGVKGEAANGFGVHGYSPGAGIGVWGWSVGNTGGWFMTNAAAEPALHVLALGAFDIAHFEDGGITPALIVNPNGGLVWRDASAAQTTVNGLPVFGALTKGVVPAAGAVPSAAKFLTETGTFAVPPGTTTTVETVSRSITQAAHGFAVGDLVKYTGAAYAKAQADVEANAEVVGIVSAVAGVNDFTLTTHGYVTGLSGLTSGTTYFLSEITAGLLTATAPSTTLNVRKAQFIALSTTTGHYNNFVGYIIP